MSKPISLTRFLIQEQQAGHINADLRLLIEVVARACKSIATAVGKGANRLAIAMHGFPVLLDDSLVRGFKPAPGHDRCLRLDCGYDRVEFGVEVLP